jgi:acyl-CoA synthetase (AMP-forming)/AMP-acid ligase II
VPELLRRQASLRGSKTAYSDARRAVSYKDLEKRTANLAGHLSGLGLSPGDRLAILLPNSVDWIEACFAALRAGLVCVPISYQSTFPEIEYRILDASCRAIVTTDEMAGTVAELQGKAPSLETVIWVSRAESQKRGFSLLGHRGPAGEAGPGLRFSDLAQSAPPGAAPDPAAIDCTSFVVYTSGTTGRAKGVQLSVHGMLWVTAASWAPIGGLSETDTVLSPLPLFHSYALNLSVLSILATGAAAHILEKFSTAEVLSLLESGRYTLFPGVPTMFHYLLQAAQTSKAKFPNLRLCISAGAIMPATLNRDFEKRFGTPLLDGYGITETSTMVTLNWPTGSRVMGSCGIPVPGLAVRIVDPASGRDVPAGEEGELIVRGPNLMAGYLNKPAETAAALRDGWYHTGDLARSDINGFLTITGRLKELIIRGGQNIAPAEIEEAASAFTPVLDCAVIGAPHEHLGEVPVIFVVVRPGHSLSAAELTGHCQALLSAYKIPQAIYTVSEIPRTGSGKIMRFRLKEQLGKLQPLA